MNGRGNVGRLRSCPYCGRVHPVDFRCNKAPVKKKRGDREAEQIRSTYRWQKKRNDVKERDHYLCVYCLAQGKINYEDLEVHHIEPLEERPDLAYEDDNLITLCGQDHEDAEAGKIGRDELKELVKHPPQGVKGVKTETLHTDSPPL